MPKALAQRTPASELLTMHDSIFLTGVNVADLQASDFHFI